MDEQNPTRETVVLWRRRQVDVCGGGGDDRDQASNRTSRASAGPAQSGVGGVCVSTNGALKTVDFGNGVRMEFIRVPAGEFDMGSPLQEEGRDEDEVLHRVRITRAFWLGRCEVTQAQWKLLMGRNPSKFQKSTNSPVESVSWGECQDFIHRLNDKTGCSFRLPTEAEWEYACRAGTRTAFSFGDRPGPASARRPKGGGRKAGVHEPTEAVGGSDPNPWGFHDMHGNVWEWCGDWYGPYPASGADDPAGPDSGSERVIRGGVYFQLDGGCRSAERYRYDPTYRWEYLGLRLAEALE